MLSLLKSKKKKKAITPFILENLATVMTLSDRLRQAGIRECEPDNDIKNSKNRKNNDRKKKFQNLPTDFYSSYFKDSYHNEPCRGKTFSKNYKGFSRTLRRRIRYSAKKTLSASLDFIKDCQKYKKKVRTPKSHSVLKSQQKSVIISSDHKESLDVKEESQKLQDSETDSQELIYNVRKIDSILSNISERKKPENSWTREDSSFLEGNNENVYEKEVLISLETNRQSKKKTAETSSYVEPLTDELPSGDVARIDKTYLQTLLSIANRQASNDQKNIEKNETKKSEEVTEKKKNKKKSYNIFAQNDIRNQESENTAAEMQKDFKSNSILLYEDLIPARVVRDSTKSEVQILIQTEKFSNQRNSEMKSEKNVAHNKPENNTRKKRKNRNKLLKNKNEEFFHPEFPNEVSKIADVKELWRRETREKSENSLSSNSSCTVPENEEVSEKKNLALNSYKVLQKFIVEEMKKISKKSQNKDNVKEIANAENNSKISESKEKKPSKESGKGESICKTFNISLPEISNDLSNMIKNEAIDLRKKVVQAGSQQRYPNYEGEKQNAHLLSLLVEDNLKNQKAKLKLIREKEGKIEKTASQIVQNWSILNRLEQAFVALGTPDFENKNEKNLQALKNENSTSNEKVNSGNADKQKIQKEHIPKVNKISPKTNEVAEKKNSGDSARASGTPIKTTMQISQNKKSENDKKRNLLKESQRKDKTKKDFKNNSLQNGSPPPKTLEGKENNIKHKKNQILNETIQRTYPKKSINSKLSKYEFRNSKKKTQDSKLHAKGNFSEKTKNRGQKKLSTSLVQNKNSKVTLERKRTFDVIPKRDNSMTQKPENYIKTDDNFESESSKKFFSQKKNEEIKKKNLVKKNVKSELKSQNKSRENDSTSKSKVKTSKISVKTPKKENLKNSREKQYLKVSQEHSMKTSKDISNLEDNCEKKEPMEELPQQILAKKELNSNERATKERSILSMRGNQPTGKESTKKIMQIEEKSTPEIYPVLNSNTTNLLIKKAQKDTDNLLENSSKTDDFSKISYESTSSYKLLDLNFTETQNMADVDNKENTWNFSKKLTPLFGFNDDVTIHERRKTGVEKELKSSRYKPLWEQDIHHYRAIVKDILSQYKRLNGFLKQSDQFENFFQDSVNLGPIIDAANEESSNFSDNSMKTDLREYRKKIISEYQALPIFEYKSKLQQKKEENSKEAKKRNLLVVKDIKAEMDLDVKDFQPNIQNVLDSQLYVDTESLVKRIHPKVKFKEKKSSLQELVQSKNEKMVTQEECPRSSSMPKTFLLLPCSSVYSRSTLKLKTLESFQEDLTTTITSVSCIEETESDIL